MSRNEEKLIDLILSDSNPEEALSIAIEIIYEIAMRSEASQVPPPAQNL